MRTTEDANGPAHERGAAPSATEHPLHESVSADDDGRKLAVALCRGAKTVGEYTHGEMTWAEFAKRVADRGHKRCGPAGDTKESEEDGKLSCDAFVPARFINRDGARKKENIAALSMAVADLDECSDEEVVALIDRLEASDIDFLAWTTYSHGTSWKPVACRFVFPLDEDVAPTESERLNAAMSAWLAVKVDPGTKDSTRLHFLPSHPDDDARASMALLHRSSGRRVLRASALLSLAPPAANGSKHRAASAAKKVGEGGRNAHLTSVAGTFRARGLDEGQLASALHAYNQEQCDPPLPVEEVARVARSVARYDNQSSERVRELLSDAPVPEDAHMPLAYSVRNGVLCFDSKPGEPPTRISSTPFFITERMVDVRNGEQRLRIAFRTRDGWQDEVVDRAELKQTNAIIRALAPVGVDLDATTQKRAIDYLTAYENKNAIPVVSSANRFGWHGDKLFMLDEAICAKTAPRVVRLDARNGLDKYASSIAVKGDAGLHRAALADAVTDDLAAVAVLTALASPLLEVLEAQGFAVHLYGSTSTGKTTRLYAGASVYGNPDMGHSAGRCFITTWSSTDVGFEQRAALLGSLPFCVDEAGVMLADQRVRVIYQLISGTSKVRGAKEGGMREQQHWRLTVLSTGELKIADDQAASGAQARVLQLLTNPMAGFDAARVEALKRRLADHHGHVGRRWLEYLVNRDRLELRKEFSAYIAQLRTTLPNDDSAAQRRAEFIGVLGFAARLAAHAGLGIDIDDRRVLALAHGDDRLAHVAHPADYALDVVREWVASAPLDFDTDVFASEVKRAFSQPEQKSRVKLCGLRGRAAGEPVMLFMKDLLHERLHLRGLDPAVVTAEWKERGWLVTQEKRRTYQQRIGDGRAHMYAIKMSVFRGASDDAVTTALAEVVTA